MDTEYLGLVEGYDPVSASEIRGPSMGVQKLLITRNLGGPSPGMQKLEEHAPIGLEVKFKGSPKHNQRQIDDFFDAACCVLQAFACLLEHCPNLQSCLCNAPSNTALSEMYSVLEEIRAKYAEKCVLKKNAPASLDISEGCVAWLKRLGWLQVENMPPQRSGQQLLARMFDLFQGIQSARDIGEHLEYSALPQAE